MKGNSYKKQTSGLCHFCDYTWNCRKNHKCNYYKKWNKKFKRSGKYDDKTA